jgi:hypothetical protein
MKRVVILVIVLCMMMVSVIASKRAVTFVYLSSDINARESGPLWYDIVVSDVNLKLASAGYDAVSVDKMWSDFMKTPHETSLIEAEWVNYLQKNSDVAVNVYVDRYAVNKDKTVDCRFSLMMVPVDAPDKVLVYEKFEKTKVKGISRMDLLKKMLAEGIHSKISVLQ